MSNIVKEDELELLLQDESYKYYLFKPRWGRLFPKSGSMREMNALQIMRFSIMKIYGCRIYVITDTKDEVLGSIAFSSGAQYRFPFATRNDLIYGPSYTVPQYRGLGIAAKLADMVLHRFETNYSVVYATVKESNISSLRCMKKNGFKETARLSVNKFTKSFCKAVNGDHILVEYRPEK